MRRLILKQNRNKTAKSKKREEEGNNYESGMQFHTAEVVQIRRENKPPSTNMAIVFFDIDIIIVNIC